MSTQANILHDTALRAEVAAYAPVSPIRLISWSIRRELWDNHSLFIAPGTVAVLVLLGFFFGPFGVRNLSSLSPSPGAQMDFTVVAPYHLASGLIMVTALLVSVFYSVDALYAERRDRSILFWKSLPVSDLTTVLTKASIPMLILPLITFAITVVTHLTMALVSSVVLLRLGDPVAPLWSHLAFWHMWLRLLGHLLAVAALWYAPFYGWFLLVSALSSRAPLLVAFLPPLAVAALEAVIFRTSYVGHALRERLVHGNMTVPEAVGRSSSLTLGSGASPLASLAAPELWLGLVAAACFLAAAVQFRRYRGAL